LLNPFATIRKRNRDKGHPYWTPLEERKNEDGEPFIRTPKEVDSIHPII
jgi:hypothetical protein